MAHVRTSIRNAMTARLTGLTTSGARVYPSRIHPLADANLPCLRVFIDDEQARVETISLNPIISRQAMLRVEAAAKAVSGLDETLDTMAAEVETALATSSDPTYGGLLKSRPEIESTSIDLDDGLEKPVGILTLTYRIHYFTTSANPAAAI